MITQGALGERAHTANGMFLALKECNLECLVELLLEHNRENKEPYIKHIKVAIYSKRRKTGKDKIIDCTRMRTEEEQSIAAALSHLVKDAARDQCPVQPPKKGKKVPSCLLLSKFCFSSLVIACQMLLVTV